jgi:uncharacterized membrane protein YuzA (DUF378 family)
MSLFQFHIFHKLFGFCFLPISKILYILVIFVGVKRHEIVRILNCLRT